MTHWQRYFGFTPLVDEWAVGFAVIQRSEATKNLLCERQA
jgi:hypothetical protein